MKFVKLVVFCVGQGKSLKSIYQLNYTQQYDSYNIDIIPNGYYIH